MKIIFHTHGTCSIKCFCGSYLWDWDSVKEIGWANEEELLKYRIYCSFCRKIVPKDLIRKKFFLNKMNKL